MTVYESITSILDEALSPSHMELVNESDQHAGPPGRESHFKLTCVADAFAGLSRVKRHQKIYALLADQLNSGVHALALHLFSPDEWFDSNQVPESPSCLGGSKS